VAAIYGGSETLFVVDLVCELKPRGSELPAERVAIWIQLFFVAKKKKPT
jgi:hypothetical protein